MSNTDINRDALESVVRGMVYYRPYLKREMIERTIRRYLQTGRESQAETSQDIVGAYKNALRKLEQ